MPPDPESGGRVGPAPGPGGRTSCLGPFRCCIFQRLGSGRSGEPGALGDGPGAGSAGSVSAGREDQAWDVGRSRAAAQRGRGRQVGRWAGSQLWLAGRLRRCRLAKAKLVHRLGAPPPRYFAVCSGATERSRGGSSHTHKSNGTVRIRDAQPAVENRDAWDRAGGKLGEVRALVQRGRLQHQSPGPLAPSGRWKKEQKKAKWRRR